MNIESVGYHSDAATEFECSGLGVNQIRAARVSAEAIAPLVFDALVHPDGTPAGVIVNARLSAGSPGQRDDAETAILSDVYDVLRVLFRGDFSIPADEPASLVGAARQTFGDAGDEWRFAGRTACNVVQVVDQICARRSAIACAAKQVVDIGCMSSPIHLLRKCVSETSNRHNVRFLEPR